MHLDILVKMLPEWALIGNEPGAVTRVNRMKGAASEENATVLEAGPYPPNCDPAAVAAFAA
jgi:hypothetical protein